MSSGDISWFRYARHNGLEQKVGRGDMALPAHHGHYSYLEEIEPPMQPIDDLLAERGKTHGSFEANALVAQRLKQVFHSSPSWEKMNVQMMEALDLIALKLSRILTADPSYVDNWQDVAGYAQLVVKSLD